MVESTAGLATGWLNWGFHDHPGAGDCTELSGLLTADGKLKAWGRDFKELAARFQAQPPAAHRLGPRPSLDWDPCITSAAKGREFRERYLKAWQEDHALTKDAPAKSP